MYNFKKVEKKWKEYWLENKTFKTDTSDFSKPKFYCLDMFPYPSGSGLHIGHPEGYTATDVISRMKRMQGFNVLHPMGFDSFGLPAEQYAIETGNHPDIFTKNNIKIFREQLQTLGFSYDWDREVVTSDPNFYKWTQWIFKQLYLDGLVKNIKMPVNWCEGLGCVLANDEVIDGKSERGGYPVVRKNMNQWVIDMPKYADKLLTGLDTIEWPNSTKEIQKNWIGKSIGAEITFKVKDTDYAFTVFTTRADTLFGATYCVLSPEHELITKITTKEQLNEVKKYQEECSKKSDLERTELNKEKTGVFTGAYAINPVNNENIPIWISDYVLVSYGTGAIMAVPAHDERDYEFATKFNIPIIPVIAQSTGEKRDNEKKKNSIIATIFDEKNNKYLTLNWGEKGGRLLIGGTIKENETEEECAIREIKEETGYQDFELIRASFPLDHHYFAYNKNIAYNINVTGLLFKLNSTKIDNLLLDEDEKDNFKVEWVFKETILKEIIDQGHKTIFENLLEPKAYTGDGIHINSDFLNGLGKEEAINKMIEFLEKNKCGNKKINYKIREWIFARQRYWGEPIPIINLEDGSHIALEDKDLPLILPELEDYAPSKNGDSPLEKAIDWVNVNYNGQKGKRETSTMPGSAGSSWYFLRYIDPENNNAFADKELLDHWLPVDLYIGGPEHAVGHLLYSRMWNNYLYDKGLVSCKEPFKKLIHQGMILGANGIKMGKRHPEFVVNPTDIVRDYGADALRLYEMFMGPLEADKPWNTTGIEGAKKFVDKIWRLYMEDNLIKKDTNNNLEAIYHQTVKKVTNDYETANINTAISQMMIFINAIYKEQEFKEEYAIGLLKLLNPLVPFITEEIWEQKFKGTSSLALETWPTYDEEKTIINNIEIGVQVNGKLRGSIEITLDEEEEKVKEKALNNENVKKHLSNLNIIKIIIVPNKIVNIIAK